MRGSSLLPLAAGVLVLVTGAALADENETFITQEGRENVADITQAGTDNHAGAEALPMRQVDESSTLTVSQTGEGHTIGLGANANGGPGGIYQGANNVLAAGRPAANVMVLTQTANFNTLGAAAQTTTGDDASGAANLLTVTQGGVGNNRIGSVLQERAPGLGNSAALVQTGTGNTLSQVSQVTPDLDSVGGRNVLSVTMSGDDNGTGVFRTLGPADSSGAESSVIIQGVLGRPASRSLAALVISGNNNQFGVTQYQADNDVGLLTLSGDFNQLGIFQDGNENLVELADVSGSNNNIGLRQLGDRHRVLAVIDGNDNGVLVQQLGGDDNSAEVRLTGNGNGELAGFTGIARDAAIPASLWSGLVQQIGSGNDAKLTVTGHQNAFAFDQRGDRNVIVGVQTGNQNQALAVQTGNDNSAYFEQIGNGNMAVILQ